jgi:hypothetical protein
MFNPLEDERVQLGVIGLASVGIVAFLTSLASERPPEKAPALAPTPADVVDVGPAAVPRVELSTVPSVIADATPVEAAPAVVEAAGIRTSFPVDAATPARAVGAVAADVQKPRPVAQHPARLLEKSPSKRKPMRHITALRPQSWSGPLPNKKSDLEE